jgi:hypothetical protein
MSKKQKRSSSVRPISKGVVRKSPPQTKTATPATTSNPSSPDKKLAAWLNGRAKKLKSLEVKGRRLKLDFLGNAREKGQLLREVQQRLSTTSIIFKDWVEEQIDIAYSTALLWIDLATNWELVQKRFADSNPLELTIRQVRDGIRDARQEQGGGKPGSGKRKATAAPQPEAAEDEEQEAIEETAPANARWEKTASEAEADAADIEGADQQKAGPPLYKVVVTVFSDSDQDAIYQAFSRWSPVSTKPTNPKQLRNVVSNVRPKDIGAALQKLGKALEDSQPTTVRVSIEL